MLYGGDYDNIMSDELATQRAEWEIYQRCRMNDSITLTSVPIYWSEVNWMVAYTPLGQDVVNQYLIRSITTDLTHDGTQTYTLIRWYPYYIQYVPATGGCIITINPSGSIVADVSSLAKSDSGSIVSIEANCYTRAAAFPKIVYNLIQSMGSNPVGVGSSPTRSAVKTMDVKGLAHSSGGSPINVYVKLVKNIESDAVQRNRSLAKIDKKGIINIDSDPTSDEKQLSEVNKSISPVANANIIIDNSSAVISNAKLRSNDVATAISENGDAAMHSTSFMKIAANADSVLGWEYPVKIGDTLLITRAYNTTQNGNTILIV